MHRTLSDELLLLPINGVEGPPHLLGATGFHLSKDQGIAISADDIDLASTGSAEVTAQDFPAQTLQMTGRPLLAPLSENKMSFRNRR